MVASTSLENMGRVQQLLIGAALVTISFAAGGKLALASDEAPIQQILAAGQQAILDRHYRQAIQILRKGLEGYPENNPLRLELGRAYLLSGADDQAIRLFRKILQTESDNRLAKLELARALGYSRQYDRSNELYQELLAKNGEDEAAAIGLASNLLHQEQSRNAETVIEVALKFHPNSLRLQEYKDRIESGNLGGEEREVRLKRNLVEAAADYVNDSAGNHSWRSSQRLDLSIRPGLANRVVIEQQFQHSPDDSFEAVETFNEELRWKPFERLLLSAGGGAVRFNNHDVHAIYEASLALQVRRHLVVGGTFSRVPVTPDAEATEHRITAQGSEAFGSWTPSRWQFNARWSRQHYSDENIGSRQSAEVIREWGAPRLTFELGYRYRRSSFDQELEHGYFSPNSYQSHLAVAGVHSQLGKRYRGAFLVRGGLESAAMDSPFRTAWEIHARNEFLLGNWTLELDYSKYHLVQDTGAFNADAGRFAFAYHF